MTEDLERPMSLKALAKKTWVSPSHLDHVFRQITGSSPRQFLGALRLQRAKQLLLTTKSKVIDTCLEVGYNSVGTFSYRFAELVGVSPVQLRKLAECGVVEQLDDLETTNSLPELKSAVSGKVKGPPNFTGSIFIGLFTTPIPQGPPAACVIMNRPGEFTIPKVPAGHYYAFCVAFPGSDNPVNFFDNDAALRAASSPKLMDVEPGGAPIRIQFELRPPEVIDPPILVAIPALLAGSFAKAKT
jgi:AraC-like DNA-binding protein